MLAERNMGEPGASSSNAPNLACWILGRFWEAEFAVLIQCLVENLDPQRDLSQYG